MPRIKWRRLCLVAALLLGTTAGWARGGLITAIEFIGNQSMSSAALLGAISSRIGQPYHPQRVEEDIRGLFRRGGFADIRVDQAAYRGGIKLIYRLTERPTITAIRFQGNKHLKEKDLLKEIPLRPYRPLNGEELAKTIALITEKYQKKRYYLVDIDYDLVPAKEGMELVFRIKEHGKAAVRRIQFVGNRIFSDRKLRKALRTKEKGSGFFRKGKYEREWLEYDVALLTRFYLNEGYLRVRISPPRVEISKDKRHLYLTFDVEEGRQYRLSGIRVMGDILTTEQEIHDLLQVKTGEIYRHDTVEADVQALSIFYGTLGYAYANIQPAPQPDDAAGTAELIYLIEKGRRVSIDQINITGNVTTRDKVIRRELKIKEGDLFNRQRIEQSRERLMALGYFEDVQFATPRGQQSGSVDLNIVVKERPTGTFNIGAGFSTAENFFFTGSIQKDNFFGRGISGQVAVELSKLRQQYVIKFSDPYFLDTNWILSLASFRTIYRYPEFDRKSFGGGLSLGHRFFDHFSFSLGYDFEDITADNFFFSVPTIFQQNASGKTSALSVTLAYDHLDNRITPSKGLFVSVANQISGTKLGGDNDFYRVTGTTRFYQPLYKGLVGKFFFKTGYIKSLGSRSVPLFERYLLGGPNSLRGYNIWTVGPSLRIPASPSGGDTRFVYGGNKMLQVNWELEVPIYPKGGFKGVAFIDVGNAYAEEETITLKNLRSNYGFGLRWNSPLGPLRFEWGIPFRKQAGEPGVVFNFSIGDFF